MKSQGRRLERRRRKQVRTDRWQRRGNAFVGRDSAGRSGPAPRPRVLDQPADQRLNVGVGERCISVQVADGQQVGSRHRIVSGEVGG